MRNVRVFYKKRSSLRFISHLDMNRFMPRIIRKTDIPVWYTEGFNSHIYLNFALPLSLGFLSDYEAMDFKVTDDNYSNEQVKCELIRVVPDSIEIIDVAEPHFKVGKIAFAEFKIIFEDNGQIADNLKTFLISDSIKIFKKNKKGILKEMELADKIKNYKIEANGNTELQIILNAGADNVNPQLLLSAFREFLGTDVPDSEITRTMLYTENLEIFR